MTNQGSTYLLQLSGYNKRLKKRTLVIFVCIDYLKTLVIWKCVYNIVRPS